MKKTLLTYMCLILGATLQGFAMSVFLFPHSIPSGGGAGLAILINHFFHLSLGFSLWLANAVFLLFALPYFGFTWTFRTIISVAITAMTVGYITSHYPHPHINIFICIVAGSIIFGFGVGLLIRAGASSGGMVIPSLMIANYKQWTPGKVMMGINLIIFLLTAVVIDINIVLYAIICQFFSTNIIDYIYDLKLHKIRILTANWRKR
ncbi:YitT family protein [Neobacillus sp. 3P2-tot-E-2]|uniref:YitT family protein n=1 Tax=Neobacillus sp. 3P2-tot-E-2 TaxID=3132212 RepID=UPI0039A37872